MADLWVPLSMEGIDGAHVYPQKGTIWYDVLNDAGNVPVLQYKGYYILKLKTRLFSPQIYIDAQKVGRYSMDWKN